MLKEDIKKNLALYHGQQVIVELEGEKIQGMLELCELADNELNMSKEMQVPGKNIKFCVNKDGIRSRVYSVEEVSDIRYFGRVTDYHTSGRTATIDEVFGFSLRNVIDNALAGKLRYKEFDCLVSCHMEINTENGKKEIRAYDVRLEESQHVLPVTTLLNKFFLYKVDDVWVKGVLKAVNEEYDVFFGDTLLARKDIEDITCLPTKNQQVEVTLKSMEEQCCGIVSLVFEDGFSVVICDENSEDVRYRRVLFSDVVSLRYYGTATKGLYTIDKVYGYKPEYFVKNGTQLSVNSKITYIPGVNERGLVAKEICRVAQKWSYGIALRSDPNVRGELVDRLNRKDQSYNKIVAHYNKQNLSANLSVDDWYDRIIVLKYILGSNQDHNGVREVLEIQPHKVYDWTSGAYAVKVNAETGEVTYLMSYQTDDGLRVLHEKEVDVQLKSSEEVISGRFYVEMQDGKKKIYLLKGEEENDREIPADDIADVTVYDIINGIDQYKGMAWIGKSNEVAFRLSEMDVNEKNELTNGTTVTYKLSMFHEKKMTKERRLYSTRYSAYDVKIAKEEVVIVSSSELRCTVIKRELFNNKNLTIQEYFDGLVNMDLVGEIRNYNSKFAYPAYVNKNRNLGKDEFTGRVIQKDEKLSHQLFYKGRVEYYDIKGGNFGLIIRPEDYSKTHQERKDKNLYIKFNNKEESHCLKRLNGDWMEYLNTAKYYYDVMYTMGIQQKTDGKNVPYVKDVYVIGYTYKSSYEDKDIDKSATEQFEPFNVVKKPSNLASDLIIGESFGYLNNKVSIAYTKVKEIKDNVVTGEDGVEIEKDKIIRFGLLTGFDLRASVCFINNLIKVPLSAVEDTTQNVMKTEKKTMLVCYECDENNVIVKVSRVTSTESIAWEKGILLDWANDDRERVVCVKVRDKEAKCHIHVAMEDVNARMKKENWKNSQVYVKTIHVYIPQKNDNKLNSELSVLCSEMRMESEIVEIVPKENGKYVAQRNNTTVTMPIPDTLSEVVGKFENRLAEVTFVPDKNNELVIGKMDYAVTKIVDSVLVNHFETKDDAVAFEMLKECLKNRRIRMSESETRMLSEEELDYIAATLQSTVVEDQRYLCYLFRNMQNDEMTLSEVGIAEDDAIKFCHEIFMKNTWDIPEKSVVPFVRKLVLLDKSTFKWFISQYSEWTKDTNIDAEICNMFKSFELTEYSKDYRGQTILKNIWKHCTDSLRKIEDSKDFTYSNAKTFKIHLSMTKAGMNVNAWDWLGETAYAEFVDCILEMDKCISIEEYETLRNKVKTWEKKHAKSCMRLVNEVLYHKSAPENLLEEIDERVGSLRTKKQVSPDLRFKLVDDCLYAGQKKISIFVANGIGNDKENIQYLPAEDFKLIVTLYAQNKPDEESGELAKPMSVISIKVKGNKLEQYTSAKKIGQIVEIPLNENILENYNANSLDFYVKVEIEKNSEVHELKVIGNNKLTYGENPVRYGKNPYPRTEKALPANHPLFFGRLQEKWELYDNLTNEEHPIFVHGQKRCGKSSVVEQLISKDFRLLTHKNPASEEAFEQKEVEHTVIFKFDVPATVKLDDAHAFVSVFNRKLYKTFVEEFLNAISERDDLEEFYKEHEKDYSKFSTMEDPEDLFKDFIKDFNTATKNKYRIYCVIDEFTGYIKNITMDDAELALEFIGKIANKNIAVIYVGHELMYNYISKLGAVNKIWVRYPRMPVYDLLDPDARGLIIYPFIKALSNHNPFKEESGERLIDKMLERTHGNPFVLTNVCRILYEYMCNEKIMYLTEADLQKALNKTLLNMEKMKDYGYLFDAFMKEEGDEEQTRIATVRYLKALAEVESKDYPDPMIDIINRDLPYNEKWDEDKLSDVASRLVDRKVIWEDTNKEQMHMFVKLMQEYFALISLDNLIEYVRDKE